jgi:hypothetical protein
LPQPLPETGRFSPVGIYGRTLRVSAERGRELLLLGVLVFIPLGFIDSVVGKIEIDSGTASVGLIIGSVAVGLLQVSSTLLGEVFYSGAVAGLLTSPRDRGISPRQVLRTLPVGRLIGADLLFNVGVVLGLLLLIAPGVIFFTWFGLVAPVIEIEKRGVREGFARSRALVRGHFWAVLVVLAPLTLAADEVINAIARLGHGLLGHSFWSTWLAEVVGNVLVSPFYAVPAVLMTVQLIAIKAES